MESAITASLSSESEDTKGAASLALGGIACGNLPRYMPSLLQLISSAQVRMGMQGVCLVIKASPYYSAALA